MIPRSRAGSTCPRSPSPGRAAAANLAEVPDFTSPPDLTAPQWGVPAFAGLPCPAGQYADYENWHQLAALVRAAGWPVGT
jgi:phospholipase C